MKKLEIIYKKINELTEYSNNSRTHSEEQVKQIITSIKEFGWTNPILISKKEIIAGHGRLLAAKEMDMEQVPTIELFNLTNEQKQAYVIADNKLALNAGWNEDILKLEIENLPKHLQQLTGFNSDEISMLINGWDSNIESIDNIEAKDTIDKKKIIIKVAPHNYTEVIEIIENAIPEGEFPDLEIS